MVRSVILVSAIALYLSLSAVEAQVKQDVSNESLQTLIKYLKDHPASQEAVKNAAAADGHKHQADKAADQPNPADMANAAAETPDSPPVSEAEAPANDEAVSEQDAPDQAAPAEEAAQAEEAPAIEEADVPNDDPKEQAIDKADPITEQDNDKASPAKDDKVKKGDTKHEGPLRNGVSVEALKESLRKIRESIKESTKDSPVREASKGDGLGAANLPLVQTNQANALLANGPNNQGVILAGDASGHQGETNMNNSTGSLPSDSTIPQVAEPTNVPITNYDMSVTAGMSLTNGGSIMSAASASMSAPASSSTSSANPSSKPSSSSSSGRPSATSTSAAHSGGNTSYNNYSLMFIGFTIFMSNMITIGFLW